MLLPHYAVIIPESRIIFFKKEAQIVIFSLPSKNHLTESERLWRN